MKESIESEELKEIMKKSRKAWRKRKMKRIIGYPYNALKSSILCLRFPFLYSRNRWTGKHYTNWKILRYHQNNWNKAYEWIGLSDDKNSFSGKWKVTNKWLAFKINFLDVLERFLGIFHMIPSYTELDAMPIGWRKCFGIQICKEIKQALLDCGGRKMLKNYRIMQIKEKFGGLRWYDQGGCEETSKIIQKYEYISYRTCIICGKTASYLTTGWIEPYCEKCIPSNKKDTAEKYFVDIDFYGWSNTEFNKKENNK